MKKHAARKTHRLPLGNQRGAVLIMVTVSIIAMFAFAVLAIDGAVLMTTRTQLHNAADAAALAGASGLIDGNQTTATERAIAFAGENRAMEHTETGMSDVVITEDDVTFPEADVIRVQTHRTEATGDALETFFRRVITPLSSTADVTAHAEARAYDICGAKCLKPWAIPDRHADADGDGIWDAGEAYDPQGTGYIAPNDVGASITLKVGNPHATPTPGIFYPINFPPLDNPGGEKPLTGARWYETFIAGCAPYEVGVGDRLQLEPGNMVGPTRHGMDDLIAQDPNAYWDASTKSIQGSAFGQSPRIGLVPFFDPTLPPNSGRNWVRVTKIGAFFIESVVAGEVRGRFIQITTTGQPCSTGGVGSGLVKGIELIE